MADLRGGTTIDGNIAWHAGNLNASGILIIDSANNFTSTTIEDALAELFLICS